MQISHLSEKHLPTVMDLFVKCFADDHYYAGLFPDPLTRQEEMRSSFSKNIGLCLAHGHSLGLWKENSLIAFLIGFDYHKMLSEAEETFLSIFGGNPNEISSLPYYDAVHVRIADMGCPVLFLLSIAVSPAYRRQGLASALVESLLSSRPGYGFAGDVSNPASLDIYRKRQFQIQEIDTDYFLILRQHNACADIPYASDRIKLAIPSTSFFEKQNIPFRILQNHRLLPDVQSVVYSGEPFFTEQPGSLASAAVIEIGYLDLLRYQRYINPIQNKEKIAEDILYYTAVLPYDEAPLQNSLLAEMLPRRQAEWSLIPDVYVSVPVQYDTAECLHDRVSEADPLSRYLQQNLDFRTQYEVGIPSSLHEVDGLRHLKTRLTRYTLGKYKIRILNEITLDTYKTGEQVIGAPAYAEFYITTDLNSHCAVITWYFLSCPFLLSHYMDNVIKNQLQILHNGIWLNIFEFFRLEYHLTKRGTPKIYAVIPNEKSCLAENQLASLLAAETIYPDGENFGNIIDRDILAAVTSATGMGQYDRGFFCAYTNVMLQFSPDLFCSLQERIAEESIALFYTELLLLEEAAIKIADDSMIGLLSVDRVEDPVLFLQEAEKIYNHYSGTIPFWDVQVNYPTSRKSMQMIREAFQIPQMLEQMQRTREHMQTVFDTTSEMIDRKDSIRVNSSLTIISMLAIISAWMDSYDYIATWGDIISGSTVTLLQKIAFILIFLVGIYAVLNLVVGQIMKIIRKHRKHKQKNHR